MIKFVCYLFLGFILVCTLIGKHLSVKQVVMPANDHFNGNVFVNNPKTEKGSFLKALRWMLKRQPPKWQLQTYPKSTNIPDRVEEGIKITPIIHASVLIQTAGLNIITDPIWSERASPFSFIGPKRVYAPTIEINELPDIDIVLISHNHYDHLDIDTIKKIEAKYHPIFITGIGNKNILESAGVGRVIELDWWQKANKLPIYFVPAQHFSGRGLFDRNYTLWGGFVINTDKSKVYFAGDTGYAPFFQEIFAKFGAMDVAILPIGAFIPRNFMKNMHMNPDDAVKAMLDLKAQYAYGIHFDSYERLADEPQFMAKSSLKQALELRKIDQSRFVAPMPGKTYSH